MCQHNPSAVWMLGHGWPSGTDGDGCSVSCMYCGDLPQVSEIHGTIMENKTSAIIAIINGVIVALQMSLFYMLRSGGIIE